MSITLKKIQGKSRAGKDFTAYELRAGLFHKLVFASPLEQEYLDNYLSDQAHEDFKNDGENLFD